MKLEIPARRCALLQGPLVSVRRIYGDFLVDVHYFTGV